MVYRAAVLFEGTNVSEGRGTTRPFELVGAPWVVAERFAEAMNRRELPGVFFRPALFEPTFHKHAGKGCARLSDARARSADVSAGRGRRRADRGVSRGRSGSVPLAGSAVRVRVRQDADRLPGRIVRELREQIDAGLAAREIARSWEPAVGRSRSCANGSCFTDAQDQGAGSDLAPMRRHARERCFGWYRENRLRRRTAA